MREDELGAQDEKEGVSARPSPAAIVMTAEGLERLRGQVEHLGTVRRREVAEDISRALEESGDLIDNIAYQEAKNEQALLEQRIVLLEERLVHARVAGSGPDGVVAIGSRVVLRDLETGETDAYQVVGATEVSDDGSTLSAASPVGKAILGRTQGESVEVELPRRAARLEIAETGP